MVTGVELGTKVCEIYALASLDHIRVQEKLFLEKQNQQKSFADKSIF